MKNLSKERIQLKTEYSSLAKLLSLKDKKISGLKEEKYTNNKEISFLRNENNNLTNRIHDLEHKCDFPSSTTDFSNKESQQTENYEDIDFLHRSCIREERMDYDNGEIIEEVEVELGDDVIDLNEDITLGG